MGRIITILTNELELKEIVIESEVSLLEVEILAIKSLEQLQKENNSKYHVNKVVYKMITHDWDKFSSGYAYNFEVIESEFSDSSSLRKKYNVFETKGEAIKEMKKRGFEIVFNKIDLYSSLSSL